ncbi:CAP domain-containing protein [Patescibacteria group bacterium]|nr:CAP domain-containing protein [Patescibacteria group bacterium]MBU1702921.1 CAP domain-containing protein [Patescibacteria group bacterium]MBU1953489.1 CAP domain-containing protein [Patescibacteria group bacterium]
MTLCEYLRYFILLVFAPRSLKTMEWRMLRLLNKDRKRHGLAPVRMHDDLRLIARRHSRDMAKRDYFDHVNLRAKSPADRLKEARVSEVISGENLAKIGGYSNPTQFAEEGLMNSPGHRANILNAGYNAVGIGVVQNERKVYFFTQNFARRSLIFKNKIPKVVHMKRGLGLNGSTLFNVKRILCHIKKPKIDTVLFEHVFLLEDEKFNFTVQFEESGKFEIWLYTDSGKGNRYVFANHFDVLVKKGWIL